MVAFVSIPVRGEVSAGRPIRSEETDPGCVEVDLASIGVAPNARTFALKVRGNSMIGAHILDNDTIVLEHRPPHDGAIVVALVDGDSALKRYFMRHGRPFLKSENPKFPNVVPANELVIQGVMVALFRRT